MTILSKYLGYSLKKFIKIDALLDLKLHEIGNYWKLSKKKWIILGNTKEKSDCRFLEYF